MILQDILSTLTAGLILVESTKEVQNFNPLLYGFTLSFFSYDSICNNISTDMLIHHVCTTIFLLVNIWWPYTYETRLIMSAIEWSTFVYNAIAYVPDTCKNILNILFVSLFFKFRIYNWYYMFQQHTFLPIQFFPVLAIYSINVYWFILICKKISKKLKNMNLNVLNHQITSYTMMGSSCLIIYTLYPKFTFMQVTSVILGISSYLYHNEMVVYFNGISNVKKSKWILLDVTVLHIYQTGYMFIIGDGWSIFSLYIHIINIFFIYKYVPEDITAASLPTFLLDVLHILYTTRSIELFTISLLIIFIHVINPFYDLSYVSTHLTLCWYIYTRSTHLLQLDYLPYN